MLDPKKDITYYVHKYRPNGTWGQRKPSAVKKIVIHHSAYALNSKMSDKDRLKTMMGWHVNQGWAGLSYHFAIMRDWNDENKANIYKLNEYEDITWTVKDNNGYIISILVDGYYHTDYRNIGDTPTQGQKKALQELVELLKRDFNLTDADILGHNDLRPTACPGSRLIPLVSELKQGRKIYQEPVTEVIPEKDEHEKEYVSEEEKQNIVNDPETETKAEEEIGFKPLEGEEREKKILELSEKIKQEPVEYAKQLLALADADTMNHLKKNYGTYKRIFFNFLTAFGKLFTNFKNNKKRWFFNFAKIFLLAFGGTGATTSYIDSGLDGIDVLTELVPGISGAVLIVWDWISSKFSIKKK